VAKTSCAFRNQRCENATNLNLHELVEQLLISKADNVSIY